MKKTPPGVNSPNPVPDTPKANKRHRPITLARLSATLALAIEDVTALCADPNASRAERIRAGHALATLTGTFIGIRKQQQAEQQQRTLEARINALERTRNPS
jgi:hypothetical protein